MERRSAGIRRVSPLLVVIGFGLWLFSLPVRESWLGSSGSETGLFGTAVAHAETADSSSSPPWPEPDDPTRPHP